MMKVIYLIAAAALLPSAAWASTTTKSKPATRWPAEQISGTLSMVDINNNLLIVRDSSGTPFDFKITPSTRIDAGARREPLSQLSANDPVSIRFIRESTGDVARSIDVRK